MFTWKTSVKDKTLAPEYNKQFSYEVTDSMKMVMDMENMTISLDIYNHDRFKKNDKMGNISIGKDTPTKLGRQHWAKVLKYPQQQISYWHPIQPPPARSRGPSPESRPFSYRRIGLSLTCAQISSTCHKQNQRCDSKI